MPAKTVVTLEVSPQALTLTVDKTFAERVPGGVLTFGPMTGRSARLNTWTQLFSFLPLELSLFTYCVPFLFGFSTLSRTSSSKNAAIVMTLKSIMW